MRDLVTEWGSPAFHARATGWVDGALAARGLRRTGALQPHTVRFWSAVLVVPLGSERAWFKVANPGQAFEGALLGAMAALAPDHVLAPWAVDPQHGWWLLPDGGRTADHPRGRRHAWEPLLHDAAELQRRCEGHRAELSMLPSLTPEQAGDALLDLVDDLAGRGPADPQHLDADRARAHLARRDDLEQDLALLAASGVAATVQLNDVHPGNACAPRTPGAPRAFFDLGDAFWSHPWPLLHAPLRGAAGARLVDPLPDSPVVRRLSDAYLEHWPGVAPGDRPALLRAADRLGALHRALSWRRLLAEVDPDRLGVPTPRLDTWLTQALRPGPQP